MATKTNAKTSAQRKVTIHYAEWRNTASHKDEKTGKTVVDEWGVAIRDLTQVNVGDYVVVTSRDGSAFSLAIISDDQPVAGKDKTEKIKKEDPKTGREYTEVRRYLAYKTETIADSVEHAIALARTILAFHGQQ